MFPSQKLLAAGADEGNTSTAVVEYRESPRSVSSSKRRKSSDYQGQQSREYRGSNLSSRSRRLVSGSQKKPEEIIDAEYEDVTDAEYTESIKEAMQSTYKSTPSTKSAIKRPSASKSPSKRPSETSTQKSPKKRVVDARAPEPDFSIDDQTRVWSRYGRAEDETYQKVTAAREDAEYSLGMRKAKTRGQQRGIDLEDVEELAYQAETNRRDAEQLKKDVRKAQERGINRATPFSEKIAKQGKAVGIAIGEGFKEFDKTIEAFGKSHMGNNIAKTNEATLKGMQEAGERARGSIAGGRANITRSALNKPRTFGTGTTPAPVPKITTRIVRRGKNDVVCYFDQYSRQISAAAARAYWGGKVPAQKPVQIPAQNVNQHTVEPFAVGRPQNPLGDLQNHGIPFAPGNHQVPFVAGVYQVPFAPGNYRAPFAVNSNPTLVVGGYNGNPIGNIRRFGNPLRDIHRQGNPLGNTVRVSDPIGMIRREGNPLGEDARRGQTSRILRGQVKKEGSPLGDDNAGHTSRMVRGQTKKSGNPVART